MATKKKMLQAAAGSAAGGAALDITDVFSTYLYEGFGTSTDKQIVNGVNLDDEGGMVWIKSRTTTQDHTIFDTERGVHGYIVTNKTDAQYTPSGDRGLQSYNTDGFTIPDTSYFGGYDQASSDLCSWTFRKAPKFFDVVTYTGDSVAGRTVSHDLGSVPGLIIIKRLDSANNWNIFHRSIGATKYLQFTTAAKATNSNRWNNTAPTDSVFTLGNHADLNSSGGTYVAYLFAHNDGDGGFGPDGDADVIKCGSYTGNGSTDGPEIDLGFEPQWLMIKNTSNTGNWIIFDCIRGIRTGPTYDYGDNELFANTSDSESDNSYIQLTPTGFKCSETPSDTNSNGNSYIYMAIRRGPLAVPEDADDVFAIDTHGSTGDGLEPAYRSGWPVDAAIVRLYTDWSGGTSRMVSRLTGTDYHVTSSSATRENDTDYVMDYMNGWDKSTATQSNFISWMWKRAPSYFDVVAYSGNQTSGRTVSHNLGVEPEMIWVKKRSGSDWWGVYHKDLSSGNVLSINLNYAAYSSTNLFTTTSPTEAVFSLGSDGQTNASGHTYIAYLFASAPGVSKVGSYTGNGTGQTIDCGFTSGARFVLIKKTSGTGDWVVHDTVRGIVGSSGADPWLELNTTNAETSGFNLVEPHSSGFAVTTFNDWNENGHNYIFYAIA